jgi:hypothetical protein
LGGFGQPDLEQAVVQLGPNLLGVDLNRQGEGADKGLPAYLLEVVTPLFILLLGLGLVLAPYREYASLEGDLDLFLGETRYRQLGYQGIFGFVDINWCLGHL